MFIRLREYVSLKERIADLAATVNGQAVEIALIERQLHGASAECADLKDDLRKVFGLKPRMAVAAPVPVAADDVRSHNQHIQVSETPRASLARLQREQDARGRDEDQAAIRQAIENYEEVLKQ